MRKNWIMFFSYLKNFSGKAGCWGLIAALSLLPDICPAAQNSEPSRAEVYRALVTNKVLVQGRELAHLSFVCSLQVESRPYFVIDISELVKGDREPRGLNRVAILNRSLQPVRVFEYIDRRPLFCKNNQLYLYGDLNLDNIGPEGNVFTFTNGAHDIAVSHVEANDLPAPVIGDGQHPPQ